MEFSPSHCTEAPFLDSGILDSPPETFLAVHRRLCRLTLRVDRDTDCLPLELVGGAALKHPLARVFTDLSPKPAGVRKRAPGPLRILIVKTNAPKPFLSGLDSETEYLESKFTAFADVHRWTAPDGDWSVVIDSFHDNAENVDAIHFCGHAGLQEDGGGKSWQFQLDGRRNLWLHPREIGFFGIGKAPGLIFFNTCGDGGMNLARHAMDAGVKTFIHPAIPLADSRGWELAANVYRRLADGGEIGDAVLEARRHIASRNSMLWAVVRLYGDPRWKLTR